MPCETKTLNSSEREAMFKALQDTPAADQAAAAVAAEAVGFWARVRAGLRSTRQNFETGNSINSPSFILEKHPAGLEIVRAVDDSARARAKWMQRHMLDMYGQQGWRGRKGAQIGFHEGSLEDIATGYGIENPDVASKFTAPVRKAIEAGKEKLEELIREYHQIRPNEKIGHIKDYLPHIFNPADLEAALKADIAALRASTSPTAQARLVKLEASLQRVQGGQSLLYEMIPDSIRMRFFEVRDGRGGYSFSAIKALNTYMSAMARKLYVEPAVQLGVGRMLEMPPEYRAYAREYLKDYLGIGRWKDPAGAIIQGIRELQFVRVMGFNPTSPIRNLFQHVNTIVEIGPRAWRAGVEAALTKEGHSLFEASGHITDVPQIYLGKTSLMATRWEKFVEYAGWMFNKVETGNRKTAYLGALARWFDANGKKVGFDFETALKKGAVPEAAKTFADDLVRKTQFRYGKVDLPFFMRGPVGGTIFQFQSFTLKQAELMWKWATREGATGRKKLMAYMGIGAGVATAADLINLPKLGGGNTLPQPVDLIEMFHVAQAITEQDFDKAKAALQRGTIGAWSESLVVKTGPTARFLVESSEFLARAQQHGITAKMLTDFGKRNLESVALRKVLNAMDQLDAGGNPADFVSALMGFPTGEALIRRKYLQLIERGQTKVAKQLLKNYRQARGGHLPLNYAKVAEIRREATRQRKQDGKARKLETRAARIARQFPPDIERVVM